MNSKTPIAHICFWSGQELFCLPGFKIVLKLCFGTIKTPTGETMGGVFHEHKCINTI